MNYSKQRELILNYVKSVKIHPTAEKVYEEVRKIEPNISLGTVYRNLCILSENGDILRIKVANAKDRFDGDIKHHYHGICAKCGKVIDIFVNYFYNIDREIESKTNLKIHSHDILFNTVCIDCKE